MTFDPSRFIHLDYAIPDREKQLRRWKEMKVMIKQKNQKIRVKDDLKVINSRINDLKNEIKQIKEAKKRL